MNPIRPSDEKYDRPRSCEVSAGEVVAPKASTREAEVSKERAQTRIRDLIRRELLKARARNPQFSLRALAKKLKLAPSALSEILTTDRRVTVKMAEKILFGLGFPPSAALPLIKACQSPAQIRRTQDQKGKKEGEEIAAWDEFDLLESQTFELIAEWHHFAILSLLETRGAKDDIAWIAGRLSLTQRVVKSSLSILENLGMLKIKSGRLRPTGKQFKTQTERADEAIRCSHFQNLDLARRSLENDALEQRHFTAMTVAVNTQMLEEVKKRIFAFHGDIAKLVETVPQQEVFRLVVQWFPLSREFSEQSQDSH